jgi:hypothetical protein
VFLWGIELRELQLSMGLWVRRMQFYTRLLEWYRLRIWCSVE